MNEDEIYKNRDLILQRILDISEDNKKDLVELKGEFKIHANEDKAEFKDLRQKGFNTDIKIATYAGGVTVMAFIIPFAMKYIFKI